MRRRTILALVVLLSACSSPVAGQGAVDGSGASGTGDSSVSSPSSEPSTITTPSAPPSSSSAPSPSSTPSPSPSPSSGRSPCRRPVVTDDGAAFCYTLPAGFYDYSSQKDFGLAWDWRTMVGLGAHDLIEVLGGNYGE